MKVFLTGGTGVIGSAVVAELLAHEHQVLGLARSDGSAEALAAAGAEPVRGGLDELDVLRKSSAGADGVIHLAFNHDMDTNEKALAGVAQERAALDVFGEALLGSGRPLIVASGTPMVPGRPATEADPTPVLEGPLAGRGRSVEAVLALATRGVRSSAVRLPRTVHNQGRGGFAGLLTDLARRRGVAGYPGDGTQRWPAVHALDAAVLFRLALEQAEPGTSWHAVADEGDAVRDIVDVIGRRLELPVEPLPADAIGPLASVFALDCPATSIHTRDVIGWNPTHLGLLADLENLS